MTPFRGCPSSSSRVCGKGPGVTLHSFVALRSRRNMRVEIFDRGSICGYTVVTGAAGRLIFGYDSYGNTCGRRNSQIEGVKLSGLDQTDKKFVFFLDPCNIDIVQRKIKSMALCVAKCPETELKTYGDIKRFAMNNGSELCSYELPAHRYPGHPERSTKCPKLPVLPSKPLPLFNRCTPVNISCYTRFAEAVVTFVSDNRVLHSLVAGVVASKEIILGLCVLALVLSMVLMIVIRYISAVLVWILTALVVLGSLGGTGVLWWLYVDNRKAANATFAATAAAVAGSKEEPRDNVQALLIYAIAATVFTVILLLLMLFMRKRVALTIALFHVAGKVFIHLPLLVFQPFWTFLALLIFWLYWIMVLLFLGTAVCLAYFFNSEHYKSNSVTRLRDKSRLPMTPILSSVFRLIRYHLGTVAKGSFIITLVKIPRLILMYIHNQLKGKVCGWRDVRGKCLRTVHVKGLHLLLVVFGEVPKLPEPATAINSTSFCTSARDAFVILVENALRVAAINAVGDFVLFLGKVLIVSCTAFAGVLALNYQRDYTVWLLPLIIVCLFAFLVAHCFLSIYEIVVDVLFLCFAIDTKYNDGSPGREFYMDKALMEFVENSRKSLPEWIRGRLEEGKSEGDSGEARPMVSAGSECDALQEFHFCYLFVGVFVDWAVSERAFVLCLTEDVLLFLFIYLPACTFFIFISLLQPMPVLAC
ncbi:choline transporter-like protein 1-like [Scleropages formosus]|uniref:Choline transporter-like protein n=1 Tax=Scleropages formosus TaxID=113540 RepID=A0A0P7VSR9_SCLFO|nr:choline transporter-like protein 1-like [Scleropages formosus]